MREMRSYTKKLVWLKVSSACASSAERILVSRKASSTRPIVRPVRDAAMPSPIYLELRIRRFLSLAICKVGMR